MRLSMGLLVEKRQSIQNDGFYFAPNHTAASLSTISYLIIRTRMSVSLNNSAICHSDGHSTKPILRFASLIPLIKKSKAHAITHGPARCLYVPYTRINNSKIIDDKLKHPLIRYKNSTACF